MQLLGSFAVCWTVSNWGDFAETSTPGKIVSFYYTLLNLPDQKTSKNSAFIEMLRLADDHLIKHI